MDRTALADNSRVFNVETGDHLRTFGVLGGPGYQKLLTQIADEALPVIVDEVEAALFRWTDEVIALYRLVGNGIITADDHARGRKTLDGIEDTLRTVRNFVRIEQANRRLTTTEGA